MLPGVLAAQTSTTPRPFKIQVPKSDLDRIRDTKFPPRLDATDGRYGTDWNYMRALVDYWSKDYDWRKAEARLNRYPQFIAKVADFDIHFYHVRSAKPNALPIVLTHGWPGSVVEFQDVIQPLSQDFDLVIPSLPGFGFSSKPKGRPVGALTTARLWHELMTKILGYQRYGAQGGDWGSTVSTNLARLYPESVVGLHLNSAQAAAGPDEAAWTTASTAYRATELDYFNIQQRKTQTVSFALSDNPVGTAAWMVEKFKSWSDDMETSLSKDQILTNIMFYLVSGSESRSQRRRPRPHGPRDSPHRRRRVPERDDRPVPTPQRARTSLQPSPLHDNAARWPLRRLGTTCPLRRRRPQVLPVPKLNRDRQGSGSQNLLHLTTKTPRLIRTPRPVVNRHLRILTQRPRPVHLPRRRM